MCWSPASKVLASSIGVLCSTVQYNTVLYSTVQYFTVQYSTVQCSTVQYSTVQWQEGEQNTRICVAQPFIFSKKLMCMEGT